MTKVLYKWYTQNDYFLFPPCIGDFIPENHPVRTVNAILDNFDISEIESTYKGGGMTPYVKYNMFHKEIKRKFLKNPFHQANMFYNREQDFYVCPMGQHMEQITDKKTVSDLGYVSHTSVYKAANCSGCPLRGMCYNGKGDRRTIEVNHRANSFKSSAKALLTSDRGVIHRSKRPIEPESCFGNIKFNHGFKRFHLKSTRKTKVEWGLVSLAHNLRKYVAHKAKIREKYAQSKIMVVEKTLMKVAG